MLCKILPLVENANDLDNSLLFEDLVNHLEAGNDPVPELRVVGQRLAKVRMSFQSLDSLVNLKSDLSGFNQVGANATISLRFVFDSIDEKKNSGMGVLVDDVKLVTPCP